MGSVGSCWIASQYRLCSLEKKKNKYRFGTSIHNNHTENLIPNLLVNKVNIVFSLRLHIPLIYWAFLGLF